MKEFHTWEEMEMAIMATPYGQFRQTYEEWLLDCYDRSLVRNSQSEPVERY